MTTFKEGDRVYHVEYGWGEVLEEINFYGNLKITFDKEVPQWCFIDKSFISFTEYTLQGFTQERPVVLPEVGELCLVRDKDNHSWTAKEFVGYIPTAEFPYITEHEVPYAQMKRIKILD